MNAASPQGMQPGQDVQGLSGTVEDALLSPGPLRQVRFDLTSRCNLRCVYCAVSHPDYQGIDMPGPTVAQITALILGLARHNTLEPIDLNGHGETTFKDGWTDVCFALAERDVKIRITSNFAKAFDELELDALACMNSIGISIDSADRKLLQAVRRRVDIRQISINMALVRAAAVKLHRPPPKFGFLCGLYDKSAEDWENLARFAIASGVTKVEIWSLTEHLGLDVPEAERVRPLDDLSDGELRPRIRSVVRGISLLRRYGIDVVVQGGFVAALARRVGILANA